MPTLLVKPLSASATIPSFKTKGSAGLDLCAHLPPEDAPFIVIWPGETRRIPTALAVAIPEGYVGRIHARSSFFFKGIDLDGVIDSDYRGEVLLQVRNSSTEKFTIAHGDRIAQMLIQPVVQPEVQVVTNLPETERGEGGFGSTGSK